MNRAEREERVKELHKLFGEVSMAILADFRGMTVSDLGSFRVKLREQEAKFRVLKNTLSKRAADGTQLEIVKDHFDGPVGMLYTMSDPVGPAKVISDFAKGSKHLELKVGVLEGKIISLEEIKVLANLPDRDTMVARVLATCQAPAGNFVRLLSEVPASFVRVLDAVRAQKEAA